MFKTVLRYGNNGSDVKILQNMLNKDGYGLVVDGSFGYGTLRAVKSFQISYGLRADGIVGINTVSALMKLAARKYSLKWHYGYVLVVSFPKNSNVEMDVIDSRGNFETLESMYKRLQTKPNLMFNGSLFDMRTGASLARVVDDGKVKGMNYYSPYGLRYTKEEGMTFSDNMKGAKEFIGFSPSLIIDNKIQTEYKDLDNGFINNLHPRTAFGESVDAYHIVIAHGRRSWLKHRGMSIPELKTFFKDVLKCYNAGNLDGGGSSMLLSEKGIPLNKFLERRKLDNGVAIYL